MLVGFIPGNENDGVEFPEGAGVLAATELSSPPRPMKTNTRTAARIAMPPMPTERPMIIPEFESDPFFDFFLPPERPPPPAGTIICPWQDGQRIARPACCAPTLTGDPQCGQES